MVRITVTLGRGDTATERVIQIDPDDIPMQFWIDVEALGDSERKMTTLIKTYAEQIGFTMAEAGQISRRDWRKVIDAVNGALDDSASIPNGAA